MVKVLYTTPVLGHPPAGGPELSVETCIKALSRNAELHVISRVPLEAIGGIEAQRFYEGYCASFVYSPSGATPSPNRYVRRFRRLWARGPGRDVAFILRYFDEHSMDVIWCDRGLERSFELICEIKARRPEVKLVCDTCAVLSRFILRELPYAKSPAREQEVRKAGERKQREERVLVNLADITTAVSDVDAEYYRSIAERPERVHLFSNVVDVDSYLEVPAPPDNFKKPCVYLAGTFFSPHSPMVDAARWTISELLPLVRREIPDIHFYLVGRGSDETLLEIDDPGVTRTGELPSVLPYLCHSDVAIVPLRFESGTRFKILEAGACGVPVVSTTLGAEGIPVTHGKDILIADDPEQFADSIVRVITNRDSAMSMARNLRALVRERFSIGSLAEQGQRILDALSA